MTRVRSICPYCGVGCGVLIDVRRGRIAAVEGDPEHPTNRGGLCSKGRRLAEVVSTGDRLLHPMVRNRNGPAFARVSWDRALRTVADGIRRAIEADGPDAVAFYLSGQLLTEDYYVANKLAKGLLGTANVDTNSRLCMASTVAAYKRSFGADGPPGCYDDLEEASLVIFWGSNAADTHPILFGRLQAARARKSQRWVVIDPRRTATADAADEHLAIRPGGDAALAMALTASLFEQGLVDEEGVRRTCSGLEELRLAASEMTPEVASAICGVDADSIRRLALEFATAPAALSVWCQGLNQSTSGTDKVSSVINLHLLTRQIGRPGAGPLSLTGQSNAMGGREVGGMATELAAHRDFSDPEGRAQVERFWGLGPVPARRGLTAVELIDAIQERRVKILWVAGSNPVASLPDGRAVVAALAELDLLVVQELYHPTDTGRLADVLLPAAGWAEKTGAMTSSERRVALAEAALAPPGEARADWEIFAAMARELGGGEAFSWPDAAAVFAEHVELTRGRDLDMTGLSHDSLRRLGSSQWPFAEGRAPEPRRYTDGRYATPDGRARLIPVRPRPTAESPDPTFPYSLTTGRLRDQWHTLTRTAKVAALRGEPGEAAVFMAPGDARREGLADGSRTLVASARGRVPARIRVDPGQSQGVLFMPFHGGPMLEPEGWPNVLPARALDPLSYQPELKHVAVRLDPAADRIALTGGELARAVTERLGAEGIEAMYLEESQMRDLPDAVRRVHLPGRLSGAAPWWEMAGRPDRVPPVGGGGVAVLDLREAIEPLAALPAIVAAGWSVRRRGSGDIPRPLLRLLDRVVPAEETRDADLVVGAPHAPVGSVCAPEGLVLRPGGRVGGQGPLSGDPATLAAYLAGRIPARAALRRVVVPLGKQTLVVAGDLAPAPGTDSLVHEDGVAGEAQVWRVSSGAVLGVAALVLSAVAEDVERLWLADPEPSALRSRLPLH